MTEMANADQLAAWNGDSGRRWVADPERRDRVMAPIADAVLAAAALGSGEDALDIGCGCGATTLAAATAVAPGQVVGIDLSAPIVELARTRATNRGAANVTFLLGDAQTHAPPPNRFAVAISRFGTMFFDDAVAAFTNVATSLAPGGRLCRATWQPLALNDWLTVPGAALLAYGQLPETPFGAPGMFALSDPTPSPAPSATPGSPTSTSTQSRSGSLSARTRRTPPATSPTPASHRRSGHHSGRPARCGARRRSSSPRQAHRRRLWTVSGLRRPGAAAADVLPYLVGLDAPGTEGFESGGFSGDVRNLDVQVHPVLDRLGSGTRCNSSFGPGLPLGTSTA